MNMVTNKVTKVLGKVENTTRFLSLAVYQGKNEGDVCIHSIQENLSPKRIDSVDMDTKKRDASYDPTIFCTAYKKPRFYMFTRREPTDPEGYLIDYSLLHFMLINNIEIMHKTQVATCLTKNRQGKNT